MQDILQRIRSFSRELRRRRVYRVSAIYAAGAFAVLQGADLLAGALLLPDWSVAALAVPAALGFPIAVALAWAFQATSQGVVPEETDSDRGVFGWAVRGGVVGVVIVASAAIGWVTWTEWMRPSAARGEAVAAADSTPDPARIAVLYFDDHSPDRSLGYLADGITEALLHELAQIPALSVASRNAVKAYRDGEVTLERLLAELRVGSLVEGSVSESDGRVRVTVQLIDAVSGAHLGSRVVERPRTELFALQDELTAEVARALRRQLGDEIRLREGRRGATSVEAWTLYRRAEQLRDDYSGIWREDPEAGIRGLIEADSLLERAERLDPEWARLPVARGWIAHSLALRHGDRPGALDDVWSRRALDRAARAIILQPDRAAGHELRGVVLSGLAESADDAAELREDAAAALRKAVALEPDAARAWGALSEIRVRQGRFPEARHAARQALEGDAYLEEAESVLHTLYFASLQMGPEDEAVERCNEGRDRFPEEPNFVVCRLFLLASFPQVEPDVPHAWALVDSLQAVVSERNRSAFRRYGSMQVAKVAARAGLPDSARAIIGTARGDETPDWLAYDEAHVRLLLGDEDRALRLLRQYLTTGAEAAFLARDWWFEPLHDDPAFKELVGS